MARSSAPARSSLWQPLKEGDIVDIVAPASSCAPERLDGALSFLIDWGLKPRIPRKIFGPDTICANDDHSRLVQLQAALLAPDSRAVWCLRGGYGSMRLLPELHKMRVPKGPPKLFLGLSDITSLNVFLIQEWKWPTVHAPMLDRLGRRETKPVYLREIKKFVFGEETEIAFRKLRPLNAAAADGTGLVRGAVTGGNIVTLQSCLGTPTGWDTSGKIIFMEEIGERGYRVDRILEHFKQAGCLKRARAVVLGDFTGGEEADGKSRAPRVLKRFANELSIPVFAGIQSGHGVIQRPLPLGAPATLDLDARELICRTGGRKG